MIKIHLSVLLLQATGLIIAEDIPLPFLCNVRDTRYVYTPHEPCYYTPLLDVRGE